MRNQRSSNTRVGICQGCVAQARGVSKGDACPYLADVPLYRVGMQERWRCRECYMVETGVYP